MPRPKVRDGDPADKDRDLTQDADTEGHFMNDPNAGRHLASQRNKDIERAAKQRLREKEARGR